jgi:hypothetical protein
MQSSSSSSAPASSSASSSNTALSIIKRSLFLIAVVLRILLWPLLKLSSSLFPAKEFDGLTNQRVLDASARAFVSFFQTNYYLPAGSSDNSNSSTTANSNLFQTVSYHACVNECTRQNKCILIYLHSPLHRDAHHFCQNVLATSTFRDLICSHQHILNLWGGSIHTADGANVAKIFNVTAYPFLALVACRQGRTR